MVAVSKRRKRVLIYKQSFKSSKEQNKSHAHVRVNYERWRLKGMDIGRCQQVVGHSCSKLPLKFYFGFENIFFSEFSQAFKLTSYLALSLYLSLPISLSLQTEIKYPWLRTYRPVACFRRKTIFFHFLSHRHCLKHQWVVETTQLDCYQK